MYIKIKIMDQSARYLLPMRREMLLLSNMMIINVLSTSAGFIQEYPYFSQEGSVEYQDGEGNKAMQNINKPRPLSNMFLTFDHASVRALNEYIWIDHQ